MLYYAIACLGGKMLPSLPYQQKEEAAQLARSWRHVVDSRHPCYVLGVRYKTDCARDVRPVGLVDWMTVVQ